MMKRGFVFGRGRLACLLELCLGVGGKRAAIALSLIIAFCSACMHEKSALAGRKFDTCVANWAEMRVLDKMWEQGTPECLYLLDYPTMLYLVTERHQRTLSLMVRFLPDLIRLDKSPYSCGSASDTRNVMAMAILNANRMSFDFLNELPLAQRRDVVQFYIGLKESGQAYADSALFVRALDSYLAAHPELN